MKKKYDGDFVFVNRKKERKVILGYEDGVVCEIDFKNAQFGLVGVLKSQNWN